MADLAVPVRDRLVEQWEHYSLPAGELIPVGVPTRVDSVDFHAMIGNATVAGEANVIGISHLGASAAGYTVHVIKKGLLVLFDAGGANILAAMNPGDPVYLGVGDGTLADAAPAGPNITVIVGKVVVIWDQATPTKALSLDL